MMEINLLPPQNVLTQKEREFRRRVILIIASFSLLFLVVEGSLLAVEQVFGFRSASEKELESRYQEQLNELLPTATKIVEVKTRVAGIKIINSQKTNYEGIISAVSDTLKSDVSLRGLHIDGNSISFSGQAYDTATFGNFVNRITDKEKSPFKKVVLTGLQTEKGNKLNFEANVVFNQK